MIRGGSGPKSQLNILLDQIPGARPDTKIDCRLIRWNAINLGYILDVQLDLAWRLFFRVCLGICVVT